MRNPLLFDVADGVAYFSPKFVLGSPMDRDEATVRVKYQGGGLKHVSEWLPEATQEMCTQGAVAFLLGRKPVLAGTTVQEFIRLVQQQGGTVEVCS